MHFNLAPAEKKKKKCILWIQDGHLQVIRRPGNAGFITYFVSVDNSGYLHSFENIT